MTTIHMDVDACRSAQRGITATQENINDILVSLNAIAVELQGGLWIGKMADEFQMEYIDWEKKIAGIITTLGSIADRLQGEIDAFEEAAKQLD